MRYYPLLCKDSVVQAILDGRQTQDRRPIRAAGNDVHIDRLLEEWSLSSPPYQYDGTGWNGSALPWNWQGNAMPEIGDWIWELQSAVDDSASIPIRSPYGKPGDRLWVREAWGLISPESAGGKWGCEDRQWHMHPESNPVDGMAKCIYRADGLYEFANGYKKWRPSIHMPRWACRIELNVLRVWVERVQDITLEDAIAEGFRDQDDFNMAFFEIYPELKRHNPWVWACEFKVVE